MEIAVSHSEQTVLGTFCLEIVSTTHTVPKKWLCLLECRDVRGLQEEKLQCPFRNENETKRPELFDERFLSPGPEM